MREEDHAWTSHLSPMGVPTVVMADDPDLLATAVAALAEWRADAPVAAPKLMLRLTMRGAPALDVSSGVRVEGSRLTLGGDGIAGRADAGAGRAEAAVPARLIGDPRGMVEEVIEPLLLFLLARSGRAPVHGAGILLGGRALVLAGPSGAGKSTLALAAARRGLPVLSDDTVHVQAEPEFRVWGLGRAIHVLAHDAPPVAFEERVRGGKRKVVVVPERRALFADDAVLVVLARGRTAGIESLEPEEAIAALGPLEPGFDLLPREGRAAARLLAARGAWRLTRTRDADAAIELLLKRFG